MTNVSGMKSGRPRSRATSAPSESSGLVGVFELLAQQHREMKALLEGLLADDAQRAERWIEVRRQLVSHERSEVRELYPVLRVTPATRELADHHDEEARELEQMIGILDETPIASERWRLVFEALAQTVMGHAQEEEQHIFPAAQQALGDARAIELEGPVLRAKQSIAEQV